MKTTLNTKKENTASSTLAKRAIALTIASAMTFSALSLTAFAAQLDEQSADASKLTNVEVNGEPVYPYTFPIGYVDNNETDNGIIVFSPNPDEETDNAIIFSSNDPFPVGLSSPDTVEDSWIII